MAVSATIYNKTAYVCDCRIHSEGEAGVYSVRRGDNAEYFCPDYTSESRTRLNGNRLGSEVSFSSDSADGQARCPYTECTNHLNFVSLLRK